MENATQNTVQITKIRSDIGRKPNQRATLIALGLRKMHSSVIHKNTASIQGMIQTVKHLISVKEISND